MYTIFNHLISHHLVHVNDFSDGMKLVNLCIKRLFFFSLLKFHKVLKSFEDEGSGYTTSMIQCKYKC